ncbi:MAG: M48 family metallopeptidase, partial [archaeon]
TKRFIQYGSKRIEYFLEYSDRKTLGITVTPELEVIVKAPVTAAQGKIDAVLHKRANWILKQKEFFLAYFPKQLPKKYISGETHLYLGRQYRLKVHLGDDERVKLSGKFLHVYSKTQSNVEQLLNEWYKSHAKLKFQEYIQQWIEAFRKLKVTATALEVRKMEKRWGSCTAKGKIILNSELIKAPRGCIEYVIVHELCHLVHHSHNRQFIDLQTRVMPTWEKWKERLEVLLA